MISYSVFEPATPSDVLLERVDSVTFVREGFAWLALFVPLLWLIFHRMWLVFLAFLAVIMAVDVGLVGLGLSASAASWATLAIALLFAFQANDLRRWTLERRGFKFVAAVSGRNREACERRFFAEWDALTRSSDAPEPQSAPGVPATVARS